MRYSHRPCSHLGDSGRKLALRQRMLSQLMDEKHSCITLLPPLNALRALEAAARHLSLTRAASELNVTPGALSHQISRTRRSSGPQTLQPRCAVNRADGGRQGAPPRLAGGLPSHPGRAGESRVGWTTRTCWWSALRLASPRNGWPRGSTAFQSPIPQSTCAFPRRSITPISRPTASTLRSATFRSTPRRTNPMRSKS